MDPWGEGYCNDRAPSFRGVSQWVVRSPIPRFPPRQGLDRWQIWRAKIPLSVGCACVLSIPLAAQQKGSDSQSNPPGKKATANTTGGTGGKATGYSPAEYSYEIGRVVVQILGPRPAKLPTSLTVPSGFVRIVPGAFEMGNAECTASSTGACLNNDYRRRTITLTQEFYMLDHEVTQDEYKKVMGSNPSKNWFLGGSRPVEQVTWGDAVDYCRRRTQVEFSEGKIPRGYGYRLPTEAEWEYACTAGGKWAPQNGGLSKIAWYDQGIFGSSSRVKGKNPNPWGLYDMLGNVDEMVADAYASYPQAVPYPERGDPKIYQNPDGSWNPDPYKTETDPKGPARLMYETFRVVRGGNFWDFSKDATTTARDSVVFKFEATGFRVVLSRVPIPGNYR